MTTLEIINTIRDNLPYEVTPDYGTLLVLVNRAYEQVARRTQAIHAVITEPIVDDRVTLPPYVVGVLTALYVQGSNKKPLQILHWADAVAMYGDKTVHSPFVGTPHSLAVFSHDLVKVIPKPAGGGLIEATCSVVPHIQGPIKPLLADTDEPALPVTEHDVLVYYTAAMILASYPQYRQLLQNYSQLAMERMAQISHANETLATYPIRLAPMASANIPVIRGYIVR